VRARADLVAAAAALALVGAAAAVGWWSNGHGSRVWADAAPLYGSWLPHVGPGTPLAVGVAVLVVWLAPAWTLRLPWRRLLAVAYLTALAWTVGLALVDGWQRGLARRLTVQAEYLHDLPLAGQLGPLLHGFSRHIIDFQPGSWATHVAGHPPGAFGIFVLLDRAGLHGGGWAALLCVAAGATVAVWVPAAVRSLVDEEAARATVPFLVLFPGAVWVGASADGLFAGVTAAGIAWLASRRTATNAVGGLALGAGLFLSYGLSLLALPALATARQTRRPRALAVAAVGVAAVVVAFAAAGFWWLSGYHLVVRRYYQGVASDRPYRYWVWADLACLVLAAGPAVAPILRRAVSAWRANLVPLGAAAAVAIADLSGLSKAETERIWLPFAVWLLAAAWTLPATSRRWWLAAQAVTALLVNHLVLTNW
jgi:methylthioxylose transferase